MAPAFSLRRLGAADAASYRDLRLDGLRRHPEAFGAAWEEEIEKPLAWFADRLEGNAVFGAWMEGDQLAGVAGLMVPAGPKQRHKGILWGMYVRPEARGSGAAPALVRRVLEQAGGSVEEVRLTVVASNTAAVRLYSRFGFRPYGCEPRALKVGDCYYDEMLMALSLSAAG
ncbi:MAG TPA: GNAT family N-acetyltransferase [Roseomonas sp.]|nr:GNAT family N-acetyltransferase [Roseomonas sp.]